MTSDQRKLLELMIVTDLEEAAMIRSKADRETQLGGWTGGWDALHAEAMSAVRFNLQQLGETSHD